MAKESMSVQNVHQIGVAMFNYSYDHNQKYPDGKSSTEVFQKLLDGKYVTDPGIFYVAYEGKVKAAPDQKVLKPGNVCFDVTGGVDSSSPDSLPLVFLTGFKVTYAPGVQPETYFRIFPDGMCVFYKANNAIFLKDQPATDLSPTFAISNFIPETFKADGKTYRQLTPDGTLP